MVSRARTAVVTVRGAADAAMRVIVATDGSEGAQAAVEWVRRLPLPSNSCFLVASVVPPPVLPNLPDWESDARRALVGLANDALDAADVALGASVETRLLEGDPREALVELASTWAADLLVVGARGLGAIKEVLLGSVSIGVVRHAPCPVLVCKGSPRDISTVTIAHDGSPGAREALRFVLGFTLPPATRIRVIGVAERMRFPSTAPAIVAGPLDAAVARVEDERRHALATTLASEVALLGSRCVAADAITTVGSPTSEIVSYADVTGTDLLVLGARGLGTMKRLLLGSVSESVLRHANCPVLVVRGRAEEA